MKVFVDFYCPTCVVVQSEYKSNDTDLSKSVCEKCGAEIERFYGQAPAVEFKGSGWFKTGGY